MKQDKFMGTCGLCGKEKEGYPAFVDYTDRRKSGPKIICQECYEKMLANSKPVNLSAIKARRAEVKK